MIDAALQFIADEVNSHLRRRVGSDFGALALGPIVDDKGSWVAAKNSLCLTVFQIEEERSTPAQVPGRVLVKGQEIVLPPPLSVNLIVLISARFDVYGEGLRLLGLVLAFFQAHPRFTPADSPAMPAGIDRLAFELVNYGPEQANQLWASLGAKHLPSVVYRIRMLVLQDVEPLGSGAPIADIGIRAHGR